MRKGSISDWTAAVALLLAAVGFWYFRIIVPATIMYFAASDDPYTQLYPMAHLAAAWMRAGEIPLWNPFQFCGHPFLASVLYGIFYPLNFPHLLLPTAIAMEVIAVLHLFLAGLFTYLYARVIQLSGLAATLAGFVFMLSGYVASQALWFTPAIGSIVWLPVGFIAIEKLFDQPRFKWSVLLAIAVAMPIFAGMLQTWTYSMHAIGLYAAFRLVVMAWRPSERPRLLATGGLVGLGVVLGVALAGVQLLPSFELQLLGPRRPGGLTLTQILSLGPVAPKSLLRDAVNSVPGFPRQMYIGMLPLLLIPASAFSKVGRGRVFFLWALGIWCVIIAMTVYTPAFTIFRKMPGGSWFRCPWRIVFVYAFAGALLAGVGLDVMRRKGDSGAARTSWLAAAVATVLCLVCLVAVAIPSLSELYLVIALPLVWAAALPLGRRLHRAVTAALLLLVVGDLCLATRNPALHPFHDLRVYDQEAQAFDFIKQRQGLYRTYIHWALAGNPALMPKQGTLRGIFSITDYENLSLDRYAKFYRLLDARPVSDLTLSMPPSSIGYFDLGTSAQQLAMVDLLSLRYIVSNAADAAFDRALTEAGSWRRAFSPKAGHCFVYENPNVLPRAYVAHRLEFVNGEEQALRAVSATTFDPRMTAIIETEAGAAEPRPVNGVPAPITQANIVNYLATQVRIEVDNPQPGYLVLTDTFYPGWKATVDDRPEPVYRANYLFRAVRVPPGRHTVTFVYRPLSFQLGGAITLSTLAVIGICGVFRRSGLRMPRSAALARLGPRTPGRGGGV